MKRANGLSAGRRTMDWVQARYLAWTAWGLLILLFSLLQALPHAWAVAGARPWFLVPLVVCIAMFTGPRGGAAAGIAAGLLWDLYAERLFGFHALFLMIIGCAVGLLVWLLVRSSWLTAWLLCIAGTLAIMLADWGFCYLLLGLESPWWVLTHRYLPSALYTSLLSPLFYLLTRGVARVLRRRV